MIQLPANKAPTLEEPNFGLLSAGTSYLRDDKRKLVVGLTSQYLRQSLELQQ
jgi:hypothetical protein